MPRIADDLETVTLPSSQYGYTKIPKQKLGSTEYSLVSLVFDVSGSVDGFKQELEKCVKEAVKGCSHSPRADNLLLRVLAFGNKVVEIHGFKLLGDVNESDYDGFYDKANNLGSGTLTALYDSVENALAAMNDMGQDLSKDDYLVNGLVIVATDGVDNASTFNAGHVKAQLDAAKTGEKMESLNSILVTLNIQDPFVKNALDDFHKNTGFQQKVDVADATKKSLAKLAQFISKSITSSSVALGSGGPSKSLSF